VTVKDVIYQICNDHGISFSQAATNLGKSQGSFWNQMDRKNGMGVKIGTLVKDLEELGCQLVVVDSETDNEYIIDGYDDEILLDRSRKHEDW